MKFIVIILLGSIFDVKATFESEWENFKIKYGRKYKNTDEENYRFSIFKNNLREIKNHNEQYKKGLATYTMKANKYTDITADEFYKLYKLTKGVPIVYPDIPTSSTNNSLQNETELLDWRLKGAVTSVKDQESCGSCYIFSSIGVLEAYYFKRHGKLVSLSAQNLLDCMFNDGCNGGRPENVLNFVSKHGVTTEDEYPYQAKQGQCRNNLVNKVNFTYFNTIVLVNSNEQKLKKILTLIGPISVGIHMSSKWMFYHSGIWYERECSVMNHAVLVVGYGSERGQDYWIIKNSLGIGWGDKGYIKFSRNRHANYCGITTVVSYVV